MSDEQQQPKRGPPRWKVDKETAIKQAMAMLQYHYSIVLIVMDEISDENDTYVRVEARCKKIDLPAAGRLLASACDEGMSRTDFEALPDELESEG